MDFIDEILIPCHGISGCRIGHALSEEISITIQNHDTLLTFSIALVKLAGAHPRPLYYFLGLKKNKKSPSNGSAGLLDHSKLLPRTENHRRKGRVPELFPRQALFSPNYQRVSKQSDTTDLLSEAVVMTGRLSLLIMTEVLW